MKMRKLLALFLALIIVFALVACSDNSSDSDSDDDDNSNNSSSNNGSSDDKDGSITGSWSGSFTVSFEKMAELMDIADKIDDPDGKITAVYLLDMNEDGTCLRGMDADAMLPGYIEFMKQYCQALGYSVSDIEAETGMSFEDYVKETALAESIETVSGTWKLDGKNITFTWEETEDDEDDDGKESTWTFDGKNIIASGGSFEEDFGVKQIVFNRVKSNNLSNSGSANKPAIQPSKPSNSVVGDWVYTFQTISYEDAFGAAGLTGEMEYVLMLEMDDDGSLTIELDEDLLIDGFTDGAEQYVESIGYTISQFEAELGMDFDEYIDSMAGQLKNAFQTVESTWSLNGDILTLGTNKYTLTFDDEDMIWIGDNLEADFGSKEIRWSPA